MKLVAAIVDWAGTIVDFGSSAPAAAFVDDGQAAFFGLRGVDEHSFHCRVPGRPRR